MNLQNAYYEMQFENAFLRAKGSEFQTLFERLMGFAYRADFMPCRPWGNQGDRKNDGYLKSERRLFQVYAPNEMDAKTAIAKITEDFNGAKPHWKEHFDKWSFVHNSIAGLPPHIMKLLLDLGKKNSGIKLEAWGLEELRSIFRRVSSEDRAIWFGVVPTDETKVHLGFRDVQVVLQSLAGKTEVLGTVVKEVPPQKIEANDLSAAVATLLKGGMTKAPLVSEFFEKWNEETLGERIAESFRSEYGRLRGTMHPNLIFSELQKWAGGGEIGTAEHQMAVLAVLAYYFERCDIFEEPRGVRR